MRSKNPVFFLAALILLSFAFPPNASCLWMKRFGQGLPNEAVYSVHETHDGGYVVAGYTDSFGAGGDDVLVMKLSAGGAIVWQKTFGGAGDECAYSIDETWDSKYGYGYIVVGETDSFGAGSEDFLVIKLREDGTIQWKKTIGGSSWDVAHSVKQTSDGYYIVTGRTASDGAGWGDFLVIKFFSNGVVDWQKTYGAADYDEAFSIEETADGMFVAAGKTNSLGSASYDYLVIKFSRFGDLLWSKRYGGVGIDEARSIRQTSDGGLIVAGSAWTGNTSGDPGYVFLVLKLASNGNIEWQKTFEATSGGGDERAYSVEQTADGGYVVAGKALINHSEGESEDFFLVKMTSTGAVQWIRNFMSAPIGDTAHSIQQTSDGGYIVAGEIRDDFQVAKLNSSGLIPGCNEVEEHAATNPFVSVSTDSLALSQGTTSLSETNPSLLLADISMTVYDKCALGGACAGSPAEASVSLENQTHEEWEVARYPAALMIFVGAVVLVRLWHRNGGES
jgi:uncharacterized delta-60 repeat protein